METFGLILMGFAMFAGIFLLGWQFGLYLQELGESKTVRDLYDDEKAEFFNDYYGEAKVKYGASDNLHHHKPKAKAKKNRKKK